MPISRYGPSVDSGLVDEGLHRQLDAGEHPAVLQDSAPDGLIGGAGVGQDAVRQHDADPAPPGLTHCTARWMNSCSGDIPATGLFPATGSPVSLLRVHERGDAVPVPVEDILVSDLDVGPERRICHQYVDAAEPDVGASRLYAAVDLLVVNLREQQVHELPERRILG